MLSCIVKLKAFPPQTKRYLNIFFSNYYLHLGPYNVLALILGEGDDPENATRTTNYYLFLKLLLLLTVLVIPIYPSHVKDKTKFRECP